MSASCAAILNTSSAREANAWHTLVYGVTLALYSIPLRQGLLGYGYQTMRGFIYFRATRPAGFGKRLPRAAE